MIVFYCFSHLLVWFYRAMLRRARYCYGKSSVRLSVRDVEVSRSNRLKFFENNFTVS